MIGLYRLGLALVVASFHAGLRPWGFRWGVPCVMAFSMISGYGISALGKTQLRSAPGDKLRFWTDRLLRIFPHYLFWLVITAFIVLVLHRQWMFQGGQPDWTNVACNVTIVPLSFFMYIPSLTALFILPQAWSLSLDLFFYAMFPALAVWRSLGWVCAAGGLAVFTLGTAGWINAEVFTYRLLPGTLPFFMLGRALHLRDGRMQAFILFVLAVDVPVIWFRGQMGLGYNRELLAGFAPAYLLLRLAAGARPVPGDRLLGNASYGVYLSHMAVLDCINTTIHALAPRVAIVTGGGMLLGFASFFLVETPVNRYRRRLRTRHKEKSTGKEALLF